jgi:predicted outer membrane protein
MNNKTAVLASGLLAMLLTGACASTPRGAVRSDLATPRPLAIASASIAPGQTTSTADVNAALADWPSRPKLAAMRMIDKYGAPHEVSPVRLVWYNETPWKRIMVTREEIPHYFPRLHMDYLHQTINYTVPPNKADEIAALDGSVLIDRTKGELTARCDKEEANILALNLANDLVNGTKSVETARQALALAEVELQAGRMPVITTALQFDVADLPRPDVDRPYIAGSPALAATLAIDPNTGLLASEGGPNGKMMLVPTTMISSSGATTSTNTSGTMTAANASMPVAPGQASAASMDAEIAAFVSIIDSNEIEAASDAEKKGSDTRVRDFARMLHTEHGRNLAEGMALAAKMNVTPLQTDRVDMQQRESAGNLARIVAMKGASFDRAWVDLMVSEHSKALSLIDTQLLPSVSAPALRDHLTTTRGHVAAHLEQARQLQSSLR